MADKIHATVAGSVLEYRATFEEPLIKVWSRNGEILQAMYIAFRPWKIELGQVSARPFPANFGETQLTFEVIGQRIYFHVFLGSAVLAVSNPTWADDELIREVGNAGLSALLSASGAEINNQEVTLSMHLTPISAGVREITAPFVHSGDDKEEVEASGFSVYHNRASYTVDRSAHYPNSLFLRLVRRFEKEETFEQMAVALRCDQEALLEKLQLQIDDA